MNLLSEEILNSDEFIFLCEFFNKSAKKTSYITFKQNLINFSTKVMETYLKSTIYSNDKCFCFAHDKLDSYGSFNTKFNIIFIREGVIEKMYKKKYFTLLSVLFHELNHFKIKYDIKLGYFDEFLVSIIKEELIRESPLYPSFIKMVEKEENTYYEDNYEYYSEEKIADLYAIENLLIFIKKARISVSESQKQQIKDLTSKIYYEYNNHFRYVPNNLNFNSYVIDYEEAFDILIKDNPQWLEYKQLQLEYYLDENRKVIKRSNDELKELLKIETDESKKEYIENLLNKSKKKNNYSNQKFSVLNNKIHFKDFNKTNKL